MRGAAASVVPHVPMLAAPDPSADPPQIWLPRIDNHVTTSVCPTSTTTFLYSPYLPILYIDVGMDGPQTLSGHYPERFYFSTSALVSDCNITRDLLISCLGVYIAYEVMTNPIISCPVLFEAIPIFLIMAVPLVELRLFLCVACFYKIA